MRHRPGAAWRPERGSSFRPGACRRAPRGGVFCPAPRRRLGRLSSPRLVPEAVGRRCAGGKPSEFSLINRLASGAPRGSWRASHGPSPAGSTGSGGGWRFTGKSFSDPPLQADRSAPAPYYARGQRRRKAVRDVPPPEGGTARRPHRRPASAPGERPCPVPSTWRGWTGDGRSMASGGGAGMRFFAG